MNPLATRLQQPAADTAPAPVGASAGQTESPAGPLPIDPHLLQLIAGGSPRGGWASATEAVLVESPRGGW